MADPEKHATPLLNMSYRTKFRRSRSHRLGAGRGPKIFGGTLGPRPLGTGRD